MDEDEEQYRSDLGQFQKKPGQTKCSNCSHVYNNRYIPKYCGSCHFLLGGKYEKKEKSLDAKMLTASIASVRTNVAGSNVRTFVSISGEMKVRKSY